LQASRPYPIKGLYSMDDFPERAEVRSYPIGVTALSDMINVVPGTLTIVTGYANMGKSTLMNSIIGHSLRYNFPVCVASFETDVKPILRDGLRTAIMRCSKNDLRTCDTSDADDILQDRLRIITQSVDEDAEMDLDAFLEYCRVAVVRDGCRMIVLDPWNEIEHKRRRDEAETEYIARALRTIKRFARQYDVAFWIVAHPSKPQEGSRKVPGLYDISGSANWANKADYGLTYHRPDPAENSAKIIVTKVRMGLPGKKGSVDVSFDFRTSEFVETDA
jgi:twinkle protein